MPLWLSSCLPLFLRAKSCGHPSWAECCHSHAMPCHAMPCSERRCRRTGRTSILWLTGAVAGHTPVQWWVAVRAVEPTIARRLLLDGKPALALDRDLCIARPLSYRVEQADSVGGGGGYRVSTGNVRWPHKPYCLMIHFSYWLTSAHAANATRWSFAGSMLGQRLRRWPNIKPAQGQRLVFCWGPCTPLSHLCPCTNTCCAASRHRSSLHYWLPFLNTLFVIFITAVK